MWQNSSGITLKKILNAWQRHLAETQRMPQWLSICFSSTWTTVQQVKVHSMHREGTSRLTSRWFSHSHWKWWFSSHECSCSAQTPVSTGWGSLICFAFPTGQNTALNILLRQEDRRQWETCFKTLTQPFFQVCKGLVTVFPGIPHTNYHFARDEVQSPHGLWWIPRHIPWTGTFPHTINRFITSFLRYFFYADGNPHYKKWLYALEGKKIPCWLLLGQFCSCPSFILQQEAFTVSSLSSEPPLSSLMRRLVSPPKPFCNKRQLLTTLQILQALDQSLTSVKQQRMRDPQGSNLLLQIAYGQMTPFKDQPNLGLIGLSYMWRFEQKTSIQTLMHLLQQEHREGEGNPYPVLLELMSKVCCRNIPPPSKQRQAPCGFTIVGVSGAPSWLISLYFPVQCPSPEYHTMPDTILVPQISARIAKSCWIFPSSSKTSSMSNTCLTFSVCRKLWSTSSRTAMEGKCTQYNSF